MKKQMQAQNAGTQNSSAPVVKAKGGAARRREVFGKVIVGALVLAVVGGAIWGGLKLFGRNTPEPASLPTDSTPIQMLNTTQSTDTSAIPTTEETAAPTEEPAALSGVCGENLTWTFYPKSTIGSRGTLSIKGSGAMSDFDNGTAPWFGYRKELREVILSDGQTSIGNGAFEGCEALEHVRLNGVTSIGDRAFSGCIALTGIGLSDGLTHIGERAFNDCKTLSRLALPASTTDVAAWAFAGCTNLKQVILPKTFSEFRVGLFEGCIGLTELEILNRDCVFDSGSLSGVPKTAVLCGFPGSTAEQYANENGYAFSPIEPTELDSVLARVAEDDQARAELQLAYPDAIIPYFFGGVTEVDEIWPDGSRYLVKLVHAVTVTATEEEIAQARQTGTLVLQGKAYRFTDNAAQAEEWAGFGALEGEGWIMAEDDSTVYTIARIGSQYFFTGIWGSVDQWIEEITDTAWVWMDGDMPVWSVIGSTLDEFTQNKNFFGGQSTTLILDEDGKPVIYYSRAG